MVKLNLSVMFKFGKNIKKNHNYKILFFLLVLGLGVILFSFWRFWQSESLKRQADSLIKQGKPEDAIILYDQANHLFPFRQDVVEDLEGARLIVESDLDYGKVYQIGAEYQEVPPLSQLPSSIVLKPNELFVPILMYHHIRINPRPYDPLWAALNVRPEQLDSQLQYLSSHNFHTIFMDDLYNALMGKKILPDNPIILSFDDGYSTFYDNAFPLLKKYKMKAIEFVITDVAGASAYLSWNQILQIDKSGLVEWGAHTRHHPNLPDLRASLVVDEVSGSKAGLENHLKKPIHWFAYPYGGYNNYDITVVKNSGFWGAVSTNYGTVQSTDKLYVLPRIMVDGRFTLDNIAKRIQR